MIQTEPDGTTRWIEAGARFENAKAHVQELGAGSLGEYIIVSQIMGNKLVIKPNSAARTPEG